MIEQALPAICLGHPLRLLYAVFPSVVFMISFIMINMDIMDGEEPKKDITPIENGDPAPSADEEAEVNRLKTEREKKNLRRTIAEVVFLICLTAGVIALFIQLGDIRAINATFSAIANGNNWLYLLAAFALTIIYFILWPLPLTTFAKDLHINASFRDVYAIGNTEPFYNGITPFALGGEPFEIYYLRLEGASTSAATGAVLAVFAVHLFVSNIFAFLALIFLPYFFDGVGSGIQGAEWMTPTIFGWIVGVGYLLNFLTLLGAMAVGLSTHVKKFIIGIMSWLAHLRFLRKLLQKQIPAFEKYCDDTQLAFHEIIHHPKATAWAIVWRFLADLVYYAIPFFLLLAVGAEFTFDGPAFWLILFGTSFAITATVWIPTPGQVGGIDFVFAIVVASLAVNALGGAVFDGAGAFEAAKVVSMLWRLFTFYFVIFVSFGFSVYCQIRVNRLQKREIQELDDKVRRLSLKRIAAHFVKGSDKATKENNPDDKEAEARTDGK
jgi:uncharacterized protein (TIRG00374 family)